MGILFERILEIWIFYGCDMEMMDSIDFMEEDYILL